MSGAVVKINVLTVPAEMRDTLEQRFAGRAGAVEAADGFEWFELLRPVDGTDRYLVYTRWRSEADFERWRSSQDFARHAGAGPAQAGQAEAGHADAGQPPVGPADAGHADAGQPPVGPADARERPVGSGPAARGSEVWSFEVVQSAAPASASQARPPEH